MVSDLYIIAAGKGSRMNSAVPKALVPITDEPCLTTTLQQIGHKFKNVFIAANVLVRDHWQEYYSNLKEKYPELAKNVTILYIKSGLGDGHATLEALKYPVSSSVMPNIVVAWGDVFFPQGEIIDELLSFKTTGSGILPVVYEQDPYVTLTTLHNSDVCTGADFSKYGEKHESGYHDQSVFRFNRSRLQAALENLHKALWKNDKYITPGGELSLLYTFHYLFNSRDAALIYETKYPTLSFNTIEEVYAIQQEIDVKWKNKNRS